MIDAISRKDFKAFIKAVSFWKIDKRKGNYDLPSGKPLTAYLEDLIEDFCDDNHLAIDANGNLKHCERTEEAVTIFTPFCADEHSDSEQQWKRIKALVWEMV